jgi:hypothetical protein
VEAGAAELGLLSLFAMASTMTMLSGVPIAIGMADIAGRWWKVRQGFRLQPMDLVFLLLLFALVATLSMVAVFAMKLAGTPGETHRIWGRYFEFFAPLIWLSAAGFIERWQNRRSLAGRLGCAAVVLSGLVGLLWSFSRHFVLFPWDATAVTAFFEQDAVRAAFPELAPYRLLAVSSTLLVVLAIAAGARLSRAWLPYVAVLGCLSTTFEVAAVSPMIRQRQELALDLAAAGPRAASVRGPMAALVVDAHDADMAYVGFKARPTILMWTPPNTAPEQLAPFRVLVALRTEPPPAGGWRPIFRGRQVAVFTR